MATISRSDIINIFTGEVYPVDPALATRYLGSVHTELCFKLPLVVSSCQLAVTAGQSDYSYTNGAPFTEEGSATAKDMRAVVRVLRCDWKAGGVPIMITPTSREFLDQSIPYWRTGSENSTPNNGPQFFFETASDTGEKGIGFYPSPGMSTSGSGSSATPVILMTLQLTSPLPGDGSIPNIITDPWVYIYGMAYRHATLKDAGSVAHWKALYDSEISSVLDRVQRTPKYKNTTVRLNVSRHGSRVL